MSRRGFEDWRFTGDPAPLARDNMLVYTIYTSMWPQGLTVFSTGMGHVEALDLLKGIVGP